MNDFIYEENHQLPQYVKHPDLIPTSQYPMNPRHYYIKNESNYNPLKQFDIHSRKHFKHHSHRPFNKHEMNNLDGGSIWDSIFSIGKAILPHTGKIIDLGFKTSEGIMKGLQNKSKGEQIKYLQNLLNNETDPRVRSEIVKVLGSIAK